MNALYSPGTAKALERNGESLVSSQQRSAADAHHGSMVTVENDAPVRLEIDRAFRYRPNVQKQIERSMRTAPRTPFDNSPRGNLAPAETLPPRKPCLRGRRARGSALTSDVFSAIPKIFDRSETLYVARRILCNNLLQQPPATDAHVNAAVHAMISQRSHAATMYSHHRNATHNPTDGEPIPDVTTDLDRLPFGRLPPADCANSGMSRT